MRPVVVPGVQMYQPRASGHQQHEDCQPTARAGHPRRQGLL